MNPRNHTKSILAWSLLPLGVVLFSWLSWSAITAPEEAVISSWDCPRGPCHIGNVLCCELQVDGGLFPPNAQWFHPLPSSQWGMDETLQWHCRAVTWNGIKWRACLRAWPLSLDAPAQDAFAWLPTGKLIRFPSIEIVPRAGKLAPQWLPDAPKTPWKWQTALALAALAGIAFLCCRLFGKRSRIRLAYHRNPSLQTLRDALRRNGHVETCQDLLAEMTRRQFSGEKPSSQQLEDYLRQVLRQVSQRP